MPEVKDLFNFPTLKLTVDFAKYLQLLNIIAEARESEAEWLKVVNTTCIREGESYVVVLKIYFLRITHINSSWEQWVKVQELLGLKNEESEVKEFLPCPNCGKKNHRAVAICPTCDESLSDLMDMGV